MIHNNIIEMQRLLNEAYYDLDYAGSENADDEHRGDRSKYITQAMEWIQQAQEILKIEEKRLDPTSMMRDTVPVTFTGV